MNNRNVMQYMENTGRYGFSLVEIMVAVAIMGIVLTFGVKSLNLFSRVSKNLEASAASDMESMLWMSNIRKFFYVSLFDEQAPPNKVTITRTELFQGGKRTIRYDIKTDDVNELPTTIFTITNKCVDVPKNVETLLPKMNSTYLSQVMDQLKAYPGCRTELTSIDCSQGQSLYAEFAAAGQRTRNFPLLPPSGKPWRNIGDYPVAGMVCINKNAYDYTLVQMMVATIDQRHLNEKDRSLGLSWKIKKMTIPPPDMGNSQYVH
ncbi:MAG: type II secretion system protein [Oligoflexales bacterium]|nr:type II secretion system protein [Oligoflexales bacterium]